MTVNHSESLIFEITNNLVSDPIELTKENLFDVLSKIIVNYEVERINKETSDSDLQDKINYYISVKKLEGLAENTLIGYKIELNLFAREINKTVNNITASDIRLYLSKCNHLENSTIAKKVSNIHEFFTWLFEEDMIDKNPTTKIKPPKFNKRNPKYLNVDELEMLREACVTLRERSIVEVLYATGTRLNELRNMDIKDIDKHEYSAKVIGKGNKEREVFFSKKSIYHLEKYLESRNDDCESLFVTQRKPYRKMSGRAIQDEIKRIKSRSKIEKKVTPHVLRHTLATLSLNNNMDIAVLSSILGHENISTTQIYAHVTDENKRYQYRKHLVL